MQSFLPKQIESSKVLKGQSAAVKHGASKGVNGVNEIFLKKDISTKMNSEQQESKVFVKLEEEAEFPGGAIAWGN